jgi:hypothetical protein
MEKGERTMDRNPWIDADRAQIQTDRARAANADKNADRRYNRHGRAMNEDAASINEETAGKFPQEATPVEASDAPESEGGADKVNTNTQPEAGASAETGSRQPK